jgi:AcrR family transcriptional regulator
MQLIDLESVRRQLDEFLWPDTDAKLRGKRERILRSASELFVRQGYRKTSVEEIAHQAGVAKGTVYLYYTNKAEIALHAMVLEKRQQLGRMALLDDSSLSPRDALRALIALGVEVASEMPLTISLVQGDHAIALALSELDEEVLTRVNGLQTQLVMQMLDAATGHAWPREQLEARGQVLVELMTAVFTSERFNAEARPLEEYGLILADIVVNGVLHEPGEEDPVQCLVQNSPGQSNPDPAIDQRIQWSV